MFNALLLCAMLVISAAATARYVSLTALTSPYAEYFVVAANDPQKVVEQLLAKPLSGKHSDEEHVQYHAVLSQAYYNLTYPQKALDQAELALNFLPAKSQPWLYHFCKIIEAIALEMSGRPAQALPGINEAVEWAKEVGDTKLYVRALYSRGMIETGLTNYVAALTDFQIAYSLAGDDPTEITKAHVAGLLAQVYSYRREYGLSIPFYQEEVEAHRANGGKLELSIALYGLGNANRNLGKLELSKAQLLESLQLAEEVGDEQGVAYALQELSNIDFAVKDFTAAENKLNQAAEIYSRANNPQMNFNLQLSLVKLSLETQRIDKAQEYLAAAAQLLENSTTPGQQIAYTEVQAHLRYAIGEYQQAYDDLKQAYQERQKILNAESTEQLHQLRSRFEVQLAQQENQVLSQQNKLQALALDNKQHQNILLIVISLFAVLACALMALMVYRNKLHKRKLENLAIKDDLTGLFNRRHTLAILRQHMQQASRHQKGLCIAMVDLDWFKQINDTFGHLVGDKVLVHFAKVCSASLRDSDVIGRIGGEEFLLILNQTHSQDAFNVLEKLREKLPGIYAELGIGDIKITISAGIAEYQQNMQLEQLMLLADTALYQAKNNGRNQVVVSQPGQSAS